MQTLEPEPVEKTSTVLTALVKKVVNQYDIRVLTNPDLLEWFSVNAKISPKVKPSAINKLVLDALNEMPTELLLSFTERKGTVPHISTVISALEVFEFFLKDYMKSM